MVIIITMWNRYIWKMVNERRKEERREGWMEGRKEARSEGMKEIRKQVSMRKAKYI